MHFFAVAAAAFFLFSYAFAAPIIAPRATIKYGGDVNPGSYIIKLKDGTSKSVHISSDEISNLGAGFTITHGQWDESFFNGYAAKLDANALNVLSADPNVDYIEEDGIMKTSLIVTESNAPWGISRISENSPDPNADPLANNFTYLFSSAAGAGVDIYVIDTGINIEHVDFGGRATWGATFGGYPDVDGNGHGTHCSGTAAGTRWGVAKAANLIAVKALNDTGSGNISDIVSALNFVAMSAQNSSRPSVASMSFGGAASMTVDLAVTHLTDLGVHAAVAAGNDAADAQNVSPARVPSANAIGATDIHDAMAPFSNFGPVVGLFAPGVRITSTWVGSTNATNVLSGTSMSTPHVSGLIAYLISTNGNVSPAAMSNNLKALSVKNAISGLPNGTINALARNDIN